MSVVHVYSKCMCGGSVVTCMLKAHVWCECVCVYCMGVCCECGVCMLDRCVVYVVRACWTGVWCDCGMCILERVWCECGTCLLEVSVE